MDLSSYFFCLSLSLLQGSGVTLKVVLNCHARGYLDAGLAAAVRVHVVTILVESSKRLSLSESCGFQNACHLVSDHPAQYQVLFLVGSGFTVSPAMCLCGTGWLHGLVELEGLAPPSRLYYPSQ